MERTNNQMIKQEKLSKALLIIFIDRCVDLPVGTYFEFDLNKKKVSFFSVQKKLVENQIHSVVLKSIQSNVKLKHLKVKLILYSNISPIFYVRILLNKN